MSGVLALARPSVLTLEPYRSASYAGGRVRLNANEAPWRPPGDDSEAGLNRYPDPRPVALTRALGAYYGRSVEELLVTRGSSEAIDLVIRTFCEAGRSEVVICPPTFGMYEVYANIQGARLRRVPLLRDEGYALDVAGILAGWTPESRLVFVCSPNNPTGNRVPTPVINELCDALAGRGIVIVDGAYSEFAAEDPTAALLASHENVIVLRTLSKALALAGVRCGALLARREIVDVVGRVLPPYCFPTLSQEAVLRCLDPEARALLAARRQTLRSERERVAGALRALPGICRVWPSDANFVYVEADDAPALCARARASGVLIRDFSWSPEMPGGLRITIGTPEENDLLLSALS